MIQNFEKQLVLSGFIHHSSRLLFVSSEPSSYSHVRIEINRILRLLEIPVVSLSLLFTQAFPFPLLPLLVLSFVGFHEEENISTLMNSLTVLRNGYA